MKPIVFLDFDGVLNNPGIWGKRPLETEAVDPVLVSRLNTLVERVDAEIVISSSWRFQFQTEDFRTILKNFGLTDSTRVVGCTPKYFGAVSRGTEIMNYMLARFGKRFDLPPFIILDDMGREEFNQLGRNLVQTNGAEGLTERDIEHAVRLLERQGWTPHGVDARPRS